MHLAEIKEKALKEARTKNPDQTKNIGQVPTKNIVSTTEMLFFMT